MYRIQQRLAGSPCIDPATLLQSFCGINDGLMQSEVTADNAVFVVEAATLKRDKGFVN